MKNSRPNHFGGDIPISVERRDELKLRRGSPDQVGISAERVNNIRQLAQQWVDEGTHPALVILASRKGVIFMHEAFGRLGPEQDAPALERGTIFPVASISKPITATAAMILVEQGLLGLNRPVIDYLPEFQGEGKQTVLVRHLLTHTSGLNQTKLIEYAERETGEFKHESFDRWWSENIERYFEFIYRIPLWMPPDSMMSYADANYDLLGVIVQRVAGKDLSQYAEEMIFRPLGMVDTYFKLPGEVSDQVVRRSEDAVFYDLTTKFAQASLGSLGVYSTTMDIAIFAQMFLNGGKYGDVRILSKASVDAMTRNQIPGISADVGGEIIPEAEWGLGWGVHQTKKGWGWDELLQSQTSYGHGGAGGAMLKVDPTYDLVIAYLSVYLDLLESGRPNANTDLFVNSMYASIEEL